MARQEDVLFCKIAITNGMVTQEQAEKCLQFCERREREGKRRPMIGSVFTKYSLLRSEDVQQIYKAVNKRLGRAAGPAVAAPPKGARKARAAAGRRGPGGTRSRSGTKRVDPSTLYKGVACGVVLIGVIAAMIVMYILSGTDEDDDKKGRGDKVAGSASTSASSTAGSSSSPGASDLGPDVKDGATPKKPEDVDPVFKGDHAKMKMEVNRVGIIEERPEQALKMLADLKTTHASFYKMYPEMLAELDDLEQHIKEVQGEGSGAEENGSLDEDI